MINSIAFPDMLSSTRMNVISEDDATESNLRLLLLSPRKSLFGDPYYGNELKDVIFSQSGQIIKDLIVDEIYTAIAVFMPQLSVSRDDISIETDGVELYTTFKATNLLNYTTNLYNIKLTNNDFQD